MADLKDTYVVHGAWTTCTCGMRKSRTVLEKSHGVFLKDRALMTVNDCKPENIICFGGCYSMENPDTAAEAQKIQMAVEKDCPNTFTDTVMNFFTKKGQKESSDAPLQVVGLCNPKILSAEWDNGGNTVEVNGEVPLLADAKVHCLYGGEIEIIDSGQPEAGDMSQVEISPHSVPLSGSPGSNAESASMGAAAAGIAATPGMPKQAVAGMIGASKASSYGKNKTSDVEEPGDLITRQQLELMMRPYNKDGTGGISLKANIEDLDEINRVLKKYNIDSAEKARHFFAQVSHESKVGMIEKYNGNSAEEYFADRDFRTEYGHNAKGDGAKYRGAGYMQLTWKSTYQDFADFIGDQNVVLYGASYVAEHYSWESAGWFWDNYKSLNIKIENGTTVKEVTRVINGGSNGLEERTNFYERLKTIL
jgi:predicted chitinase